MSYAPDVDVKDFKNDYRRDISRSEHSSAYVLAASKCTTAVDMADMRSIDQLLLTISLP